MAKAQDATDSEDLMFQPLCAVFRRFLKREGLKFTPERAISLDAVLAKENVFEAGTLYDEIRTAGHHVSRATLYRTLKHLQDAKIIAEVLIDSKQAHYELCFGKKPVGHLVCVDSSQVTEFTSPQIEELRDRICEEHGYKPVSVRLVVYGVSSQARDDNV